MVLAIGQDNAFPFIERNIGLEFGKWDMPVVDKTTFMSTRAGVFFGGDAAFGPANIIWAVEHGHQAAISIHNYCQGIAGDRAPAAGHDAGEHEDGAARVGLQQRLQPGAAPEDGARRDAAALREDDHRGGAGVHGGADARRGRALPQLRRRRPHFTDSLCIECDACIDICPVDCLTIVAERRRSRICGRGSRAPADNLDQPLFVSGPLKQTGRVMVKDENVCLHCGLCAERCPTYAWDMRRFTLQLPYAWTRGHVIRVGRRVKAADAVRSRTRVRVASVQAGFG